MHTLKERAEHFRHKYHREPCIVLQGVDVLATYHPEVFFELVRCAKHFPSRGTMSIVLVSYEGHLMPLMDDISLRARAIEVKKI